MLTVDHRCRGPTSSGNGGYVAGRLAGDGDEPVTVVLKAAPPLDRPLTVTERDGLTETSVYGADRRRLGRAASVWITVPGDPG